MSKRSGVRCKGPAIAGSTSQKCRMHGGNATSGVAAPGFKHGRYSRVLPPRMAELYEEAKANPDLIEMGDHIALLEARIQSLLGLSTEGEPAPKWSGVAEVFAEVETAILSGDIAKITSGMELMHKMLDAGVKWDRTWEEVNGTLEQLRKMTDTEVKRKKELHQMVPIERVMVLMAAVGDAVKRHVTDPKQIQAVYGEIALLHNTDRTRSGNHPLLAPDTFIDVESA